MARTYKLTLTQEEVNQVGQLIHVAWQLGAATSPKAAAVLTGLQKKFDPLAVMPKVEPVPQQLAKGGKK